MLTMWLAAHYSKTNMNPVSEYTPVVSGNSEKRQGVLRRTRRRSARWCSPEAGTRRASRGACCVASCARKSDAGCFGTCRRQSAALPPWTTDSCSWAAIPAKQSNQVASNDCLNAAATEVILIIGFIALAFSKISGIFSWKIPEIREWQNLGNSRIQELQSLLTPHHSSWMPSHTHGRSRPIAASQHHDIADEDVDQFRCRQHVTHLLLAVSGHVTLRRRRCHHARRRVRTVSEHVEHCTANGALLHRTPENNIGKHLNAIQGDWPKKVSHYQD